MLKRFYAKSMALFAALSFFLFSLQAHALTCTDTSATSICTLAGTVDFKDIKEGIIVITGALVVLGILFFGARTLIRWARGRTG